MSIQRVLTGAAAVAALALGAVSALQPMPAGPLASGVAVHSAPLPGDTGWD